MSFKPAYPPEAFYWSDGAGAVAIPDALADHAAAIVELLEPHYAPAVIRKWSDRFGFISPDVRNDPDNQELNIPELDVPQEIFTRAVDHFIKLMSGLFRACAAIDPDLRSLGWTQGSSYFNDGEPLYFQVSAAEDTGSVEINGESADDLGFTLPGAVAELATAVLRRLPPPAFYLLAGGNHMRVEITADGFYASAHTEHD